VARAPKTRRSTRHDQSMASCLRQFLTPQVWKQARRGLGPPRKGTRWDFHTLILVPLAMTWSAGDSTPERFEMARGIVAICRPKRLRPGRTAQGFQKALGRLPMRPMLALADAVRGRLRTLLGDDLLHHGFIPIGCDGSRLDCVRNDELLARLGKGGRADGPPSIWVTALVHLTTGVPWAWRLGKADASERDHLRSLLRSLPGLALVVADAGFDGYDLMAAILGSDASFLIRISSRVRLIAEEAVDPAGYRQGPVRLWPKAAQADGRPQLQLRLIRVAGVRRRRAIGGEPRRAADVWLLTDVGPGRMSAARAASFYRLRWENEGLFRSYKRTLAKVKLTGRTVRSVHREAFGSLLACQLLLAQGAWALRQGRSGSTAVRPCSARRVLVAIRAELRGAMRPDHRASYQERLGRASRERRARTTPKQKRDWPQRTPHEPPRPPKIRTMTEKEKALLARLNAAQ
jgi:hypothetical protein